MEKGKTLESQFDNFIKLYIIDAKKISKKYRIKRAEAMLLLNRFELSKIHYHLDQTELKEQKK